MQHSTQERSWPRISIVTPSLNQAEFLERTILSVLNQNYPNLEYIIVDGGSTDNSIEIIRKYEKYLAHWVSEPDDGQSDALNKGFLKSTGEILGSLNSDDTYEPDALTIAAQYFATHPDADVVYGNANLIDVHDEVIRELRDTGFNKGALIYGTFNIPPQSTFYRRELFFRVGMFRKDLFNAMDYDILLRFCKHDANFAYLAKSLANFRTYADNKTSKYWTNAKIESDKVREEVFGIHGDGLLFRWWRFFYQMRRIALFLLRGELSYTLSRLGARYRSMLGLVSSSGLSRFWK